MLFWLWMACVWANPLHSVELTSLSLLLPNFIIPIENSDLSLVSHPDREYYTLIALTSTDERHACDSCHDLDILLLRVAKAWFNDHAMSNYLFFTKVDIVDRSNLAIFEFLELQSVPQIWLIPPSRIAEQHKKDRPVVENEVFGPFDILLEPHAEFQLPDTSFDDQVFQFADWLAITVQKRIFIRQENAVGKFAMTFFVTFALILFVKKRGPSAVTQNVSKGRIYKVLSLVLLLVLLGGYLYTMLEGVPFVAQNDKGEVIYISGGTHYQFGVEIVLVAVHYFLLGAALVTLTYLGQYTVTGGGWLKTEEQKAVCVVLGAAVLFLFYSSFTSMYLRKDSEYPYHFLKLF